MFLFFTAFSISIMLYSLSIYPNPILMEENKIFTSNQAEWSHLANYQFYMKDTNFPKTKNIIIQVVLVNIQNHWVRTFDSKNLHNHVGITCDTARKWNEGIITLYNLEQNIEICNNWNNSKLIHFHSLLTNNITLQDERLFIAEQLIRQFELWKIYESDFFTFLLLFFFLLFLLLFFLLFFYFFFYFFFFFLIF